MGGRRDPENPENGKKEKCELKQCAPGKCEPENEKKKTEIAKRKSDSEIAENLSKND